MTTRAPRSSIRGLADEPERVGPRNDRPCRSVQRKDDRLARQRRDEHARQPVRVDEVGVLRGASQREPTMSTAGASQGLRRNPVATPASPKPR